MTTPNPNNSSTSTTTFTIPTATPTAETKPAAPAQEPEKAELDWKAEARKWEQRAKENKAAAEKLAAFEESQKTEAQKLADRAAAAEKERDAAKLEALRTKVGMQKKLPTDVIDLLKGDTEEELAAHADRLSEHFKASVRPAGSVDQGTRGSAPAQNPRDAFAGLINKAIGQQ